LNVKNQCGIDSISQPRCLEDAARGGIPFAPGAAGRIQESSGSAATRRKHRPALKRAPLAQLFCKCTI
jgi:hypothetical protein